MSSSSPIAVRRSASSPPARTTSGNNSFTARARLDPDGTVMEMLADGTTRPLKQRVDWSRVDATTEADIALYERQDAAEAMHDAAAWARHVRQRLGLSQLEFSRRIGVSVAIVRDWEHGRKAPTGPARALLRLIGLAPKAALAALTR